MKTRHERGPGELFSNYFRLIAYSLLIGVIVGAGVAGMISIYGEVNALRLAFQERYGVLSITIPALGVLAAYMIVKNLGSSKRTGGGSHRILEAFHYEGGRITLRDTVVGPFASAVTIGSGGSAGFEGPGLLLGGGLGSVIAQRLGLGWEEVRVFLLAGASAGMAAVFKAPLTGILFGLELPYKRDMARKAFIPATIASISSYIVTVTLIGGEKLFPFLPELGIPLERGILDAFLLGLVMAVVGVAFVKLYELLGGWVWRIKINRYVLALTAGLAVGLVGYFLPQALGVGYPSIESAIAGDIGVQLLVLLLVTKLVLTCITLRLGGSGGLFVPSLFLGAMAGAVFEITVPGAHDPALVMAAMAASIAVTNKTLLTGVAFVAETSGPGSIIITLIAGATAYFLTGSVSFYESLQPVDELEAEEEMISTVYHRAMSPEFEEKVRGVKVRDLMHTDPFYLRDSETIGSAYSRVVNVAFKEYPVTGEGGRLLGVLTLEDFLLCDERTVGRALETLHMRVAQMATPEADLLDIAPVLLESEMDNLYVVEDLASMRLVGVLNETEVLKAMLTCTLPSFKLGPGDGGVS